MFRNMAILILVSSSLMGCGLISGKADAEKVAIEFFEHRIASGGFGKRELYSNIFWENTDKEKWQNIEKLVDKTMGKLQSYELNTWNLNSSSYTGTGKTPATNGTVAKLVYKTVYEKGTAVDTVTLHKPTDGTTFRIIGMNFNSKMIQDAIDKSIENVVAEDPIPFDPNDTLSVDPLDTNPNDLKGVVHDTPDDVPAIAPKGIPTFVPKIEKIPIPQMDPQDVELTNKPALVPPVKDK